MNNQRGSLEYLNNEQRCSNESIMILELLEQQGAIGRRTKRKRSKAVIKARDIIESNLKSKKIRPFIFALFTSLVIIVGVLTVCLTSPKQSKKCELTYQRMMKSSIMVSSHPRSVAIGDLNNDHQMDMVVANSETNTIGIFISKGDGTFTEQKIYYTGFKSRPSLIVVSHFNNDSYLDIAVANYGTNNIGIFLGKGNGTFNDQKVFSLGSSHPLFVTVGDFNKDTRTDIVVANYGTDSVGILLGDGNGSFQHQVTYSTGYDSNPYSIAIGDFNNDTQLDIAVANYGTNNIGIFFGYDNGTFASLITYTTTLNSHPSSIAVGDFNNDNQLDLVVSNNGTGNIGIFLGHANGSFLPQTTYSIDFNSYPQYVTVGDFDKNNILDIVVVDSKNDRVHILPGIGNGDFATIATYDTISGSSPIWIAVADFNNDNQSDIVVVNFDTNNLLVLNDYSTKPSVRETKYRVGKPSYMVSVAVTDFNNDHILDIVSVVKDSIVLLIGLGNGIFSRGATYSIGDGSTLQYVCVGDLNNDNRMDVITANPDNSSVSVFLGHGDGTFTPMPAYSSGIGSKPWWIALGDFNHDNCLDIVSANTGSNTIGVFLGNGNGTFATVVNYSTGVDSHPYSVAVGDIDNDNHLDLVVVNEAGMIILFIGYGNGTFIISRTYSMLKNSILFMVILVDFNNDSYLDIAVTQIVTNNIAVFLGYGNGTFATPTTYSTGSGANPYYVIAADFNNDKIYDIAVTNFQNDEILILYGYGNGSFELARRYSTGYGSKPYGIAAADFDNNKKLEMVVALWGTGYIAVLTEYNAANFNNQIRCFTGSAPQPFSVAAGDFNNDNRSDIVVANSGTDNLGIIFGMGNDTFGMEMMYSIDTDSYPQYVITCDINKDNQLDIVSVNSKTNSISIIMGYGNGTFAKKITYSTGDESHPYAVAADDFNNDHQLDLVVVNEGADSIGIFFGFNYISFQNPMTYPSINNLNPAGIAVSDFNNDNFLDIAAVFEGSNSVGILLGYGNGSFSSMMHYSTGNNSQPEAIAVGDFNKDGRSDIVVANQGTKNIGVLLGYGNGSFAPMMTYSNEHDFDPYHLVVTDLNNDGQLDIVVANNKADNIAVLCGYNNGTFSVTGIYSTGTGSVPRVVTTGDFNNDGNLDIAVANWNGMNVGVLLGHGNGTFENQTTFTVGPKTTPYWIVVADFNSDNQLDIATVIWSGIGILSGYGNGTFATIKTYSTGDGSFPQGCSVADFNNDNILDIAVANYGTNSIVILFGCGGRGFLLGKSYSTGTRSSPVRLVIADFNSDSRLDMAAAAYQSNNINVFLGNSSEPFGAMTTYSTGEGSYPHAVAVSDLNKDGWADIVVANYGTNNVGIFLGRGDGTFDLIMTYPTGKRSAPSFVAIADFNNDHYLDIVVTNSETDNIAIFFGDANGTFAIKITYLTGVGSRPYAIAIGYFNDDNIWDLVIANSGTSNILILYGNGNGTFGNKSSYSLGYNYHPYSIAVKDLNQDGWMDIVIACYDTDHVETLIKTC